MDAGTMDAATMSAILGGLMAYSFVLLAIGIVIIVANWKIYTKAGKPGWASIIPFYGQYVMFDFVWGNGWLFLLMLVPFVNGIVGIILLFKMASAFGKGVGFGFGLLFLSPIFLCILAFGSATYVGPQ